MSSSLQRKCPPACFPEGASCWKECVTGNIGVIDRELNPSTMSTGTNGFGCYERSVVCRLDVGQKGRAQCGVMRGKWVNVLHCTCSRYLDGRTVAILLLGQH
ncbi:unnamed protein product [Mycena citricolor]|uniref:Uncharacterized protein n=1 Tax=Mycena citricolor TaxID=2018698 RepID=A0AAD2Q7C5_9AGAR|nr:unnamed protein product [Mycena citricolor]